MRKLLKKYGFVPDKLVTDDLRSYAAAAGQLGIAKPTSAVNGATTEPRIRINRPDDENAKYRVFFQRPTPSHLRKNAPSLQGHGDADVARRRRCGVSPTCQQICYVLYLVM
jgi:hypothetical protein